MTAQVKTKRERLLSHSSPLHVNYPESPTLNPTTSCPNHRWHTSCLCMNYKKAPLPLWGGRIIERVFFSPSWLMNYEVKGLTSGMQLDCQLNPPTLLVPWAVHQLHNCAGWHFSPYCHHCHPRPSTRILYPDSGSSLKAGIPCFLRGFSTQQARETLNF